VEPTAGTCIRLWMVEEQSGSADQSGRAQDQNPPNAPPGSGMAHEEAPDLSALDDEDWFGDGSAFDSGEDLAAALLVMAGAGSAEEIAGSSSAVEIEFDPVQPQRTPPADLPPAAQGVEFVPSGGGQEGQTGSTEGWRVVSGLGERRAGAHKWSFRHGILAMRQTEDAMGRLQRGAVETAWAAAAVTARISRSSGVSQ